MDRQELLSYMRTLYLDTDQDDLWSRAAQLEEMTLPQLIQEYADFIADDGFLKDFVMDQRVVDFVFQGW